MRGDTGATIEDSGPAGRNLGVFLPQSSGHSHQLTSPGCFCVSLANLSTFLSSHLCAPNPLASTRLFFSLSPSLFRSLCASVANLSFFLDFPPKIRNPIAFGDLAEFSSEFHARLGAGAFQPGLLRPGCFGRQFRLWVVVLSLRFAGRGRTSFSRRTLRALTRTRRGFAWSSQ